MYNLFWFLFSTTQMQVSNEIAMLREKDLLRWTGNTKK